MRLSWIGAVAAAAAIALPAIAAPNTSTATAEPQAMPATQPLPRRGPAPVEHYVDLNSASRKELMTLPGIGNAEADLIVARRPYLVKTELVSKNVLPVGPYLSIKHLVVALPKSVTQAKH